MEDSLNIKLVLYSIYCDETHRALAFLAMATLYAQEVAETSGGQL